MEPSESKPVGVFCTLGHSDKSKNVEIGSGSRVTLDKDSLYTQRNENWPAQRESGSYSIGVQESVESVLDVMQGAFICESLH